jgi:hypothetical protein
MELKKVIISKYTYQKVVSIFTEQFFNHINTSRKESVKHVPTPPMQE